MAGAPASRSCAIGPSSVGWIGVTIRCLIIPVEAGRLPMLPIATRPASTTAVTGRGGITPVVGVMAATVIAAATPTMAMAGDITQGTAIRPPAHPIMRSVGRVLTGSLIGMQRLPMVLPHVTNGQQNPHPAAGIVGGRAYH